MIAETAGFGRGDYGVLFDRQPVAIAWIDLATMRILKANSALADVTGFSVEELLTKRFDELTHPDDRSEDSRRFAAATDATPPWTFERRLLRCDGTAVWLQAAEAYFSPPGTSALMAALTFVDGSDRRRAIAQLVDEEERLRLSLETAQVGCWELDIASGRLQWDAQHAALFGYAGETRDDWSSALRSAVAPDDVGEIDRKLVAAIESGLLCSHMFKIRRADTGEERWIQSYCRRYPESFSRPARMMGIALDRTDEMRARFALEESEEHYRHAIELSPQVPWTAAPDGMVETFSERWLRITGLTREEALGDGWTKVVHPDDLAHTAEIWRRSLETGEPGDVEYRIRHADGVYRWMRARAFPRFNERGEIVRWYGTNEDIHERKLAQERLEERVRQRTAELESFVHAIAHDLRGPMRSIAGTSQILLEDHAPDLCPEAAKLLGRQTQAVLRLNDLVEGLLRFALLGMADLELQDVDLTALAAVVAADVERRYPEIRFDVERGLRARADPAGLRTLLENLFENAAKYSPAGGGVTFRRSADGLAFEVRDQGMGFEPGHADRIFDPFARLVSSTKIPGTGLGLASVRKIVEMHGGRVWAESAPGEGASFFFTLGT